MAVHLVQTLVINVQHVQGTHSNFLGNDASPFNLGEIPDPTEYPVCNPRGTS